MRVSITSPLVQPSPNGRRVGIRIVTFEACSGFTRVTARRIAQPPKVTFVTRLRSRQLPSETARQLPDLSTIIRVEPSSTDDSRLQGALPITDLHCLRGCEGQDRSRLRVERVKQRFGVFKIGRVESFGEPIADRGEEVASRLLLIALNQVLGERNRRLQLRTFGALFLCSGERLAQGGFSIVDLVNVAERSMHQFSSFFGDAFNE